MNNVKQVHTRQRKKVGCIYHQSTGNNSALLLGKCSAVMSLWYCHLGSIQTLTMPNLTMAPPTAQTGTNMTCLVLWQVKWSNDTRTNY